MEKVSEDELSWTQLKAEMQERNKIETTGEKILRKSKEAPLVPIGCLATVAALTYGLVSFRRGNVQMSQNMMRARVLAQGFTIFVAVASVMMATKPKKDSI